MIECGCQGDDGQKQRRTSPIQVAPGCVECEDR